MNKREAQKKYKDKISLKLWWEYHAPDTFLYLNCNDPELQKFKIRLPPAPDWQLIEGFGLPVYDQVFTYEQIPERLIILEENLRRKCLINRKRNESKFSFEKNVIDSIWGELENNSIEYKYEINWIKKQWYYRRYGRFYFINGKVTYIDPWHWYFLNYFHLEAVRENNGLPAYRDRDRKWFHAQRYAYTTTETPIYKSNGDLDLNLDDTPKMRNVGSRTVFGTNCLKGRRVGDTSKALSILLNESSCNFEIYNGIQGNKESTAEGIFKEKLMFAFRKMPFFFIPEMPNLNHATELVFNSPEFRGGLNSKIDFATTSKRHYYDSKKLAFIFADEIGKTENESVDRRHEVLKRCISPGVNINGFMINTSTVDNMELSSAKEFEKLSRASHFEDRMPNGQTKSGLINLHFSIVEGYEGFIDRFGASIVDKPTKEQIPYMGRIVRDERGEIMGCKDYIKSVEKDYLESGDMMRLCEFQRMNPITWKDCWANIGKNFFFNINLLRGRRAELATRREDNIIIGNFVWKNGFGSEVEFIEDEDGKFRKSMDIAPSKRSKIIFDGVIKRPAFKDIFIASSDAFRLEKTDGYRMSKGSGAVLYMHDPNIDSQDKDVRDYTTNKFVCTYLFRPDTREEYCEDMLKMCIYFGALMYGESNIDIVNDFFIRKGFSGYLLFNIDPVSGRKKNNAGFNTSGPNIKQKLFNLASDWINLHAQRCDHIEIIEEMLSIEGPDKMTDHDLFVSIVGCLLGQESNYVDFVKQFSNKKIDVKGFW